MTPKRRKSSTDIAEKLRDIELKGQGQEDNHEFFGTAPASA
jgi:hypothetical protein